jgi:hypothetical protein
MAIKFEVIIVGDEHSETMGASTSILYAKDGYTQHENDLAQWLKSTVDGLFKTKFNSTQYNVNTSEENSNVH